MQPAATRKEQSVFGNVRPRKEASESVSLKRIAQMYPTWSSQVVGTQHGRIEFSFVGEKSIEESGLSTRMGARVCVCVRGI